MSDVLPLRAGRRRLTRHTVKPSVESLELRIVLSDLVGTRIDADPDHIIFDNVQGQPGATTLQYSIANLGSSPAGSSHVEFFYSSDSQLGVDDVSLGEALVPPLDPGETHSSELPVQVDREILFQDSLAVAFNPRGAIDERFHIFMVTDTRGEVSESNEENNSEIGLGQDTEDVFYFPWDIDGNGGVTPTDVSFCLDRFFSTDQQCDFNASGQVTPVDLSAALDRFFTSHSVATPVPVFNVDPAQDSAPLGDLATTFRVLTLVGQTDPSAELFVSETGERFSANAAGQFRLPGIDIQLGDSKKASLTIS